MGQAIYVGKVARAAELTPQAIRYDERLGLIQKAQRTSSGYRVYPSTALDRVRFIKQAQGLRLGLAEIREVLQLKYSGQSPCNCVRELLKQKLIQLKKQMVAMEKVREEIEISMKEARPYSCSSRRPYGPRR